MSSRWMAVGCAGLVLATVGCGGHKATKKPGASTAAPVATGTAPVTTGTVGTVSSGTTGTISSGALPQPPVSRRPAGATQVVFQYDADRGKDATVASGGAAINDNAGRSAELLVGDQDGAQSDLRSFVELGLARVPAGSQVLDAKLELWVTGSRHHDEDVTVQLHRVVPTQNKNGSTAWQTPWREGGSTSDADLDGICWDGAASGAFPTVRSDRPQHTQPDVDTTSDYGHGPTGVVAETVVPRGAAGQWVAFDVTPLVAQWVSGLVENHGLRLSHPAEGAPWLDGVKVFASSDHADATKRPRLTVDYVPPAGKSFLVIQPDAAAGKDTWVREEGLYANDNYGAWDSLLVGDRTSNQLGDRRAYVEVAIAGLPAGATIDRATLELFHFGTSEGDEDLQLRVLRVIETVNKNGQGARQTPWVEGTTTHDAALDGMSWDGDLATGYFPHSQSGRPELTQPNVDETTNYGRGPTGILDEVLIARGTVNQWVVLDVTGAVRAWTSGQAPNYGLRLMQAREGAPYDTGTKHFFTSDAVNTPNRRPILRIEYH